MGASVTVEGLCIVAGRHTLVDHLSFTIRPGEVLALIGESGSGKTTTALALMGYARHGCRISEGSVRIGDVDMLHLSPAQQRAMRGRGLASSLMRLASEHLAARGYREVYTDTVPSNVASQRTILRAGFVPCAISRAGETGPHAP